MKLGERVPIPQWLILLVFFSANVASAAEVYVSPSGNDANPGASERPLATIQRLGNQSSQPRPKQDPDQARHVLPSQAAGS